MFHSLSDDLIAGIEHPKLFTNPFDYSPHPLVEVARRELCGYLQEQEQWHAEIAQGKMFGVAVVENQQGVIGFLAAFSGYLAKQTIHPYFVPPILDLLEPNGFFATEEASISQINELVAQIDSSEELSIARSTHANLIELEHKEIGRLKAEYATAREHRRTLRATGESIEQLNAESQRQKGALRRRELYFRQQRACHEQIIESHRSRRATLVEQRQQRSAALQSLTFSRFAPLNARGESRDLITIFNQYNASIPPAGSGECAAPKLLHYAFANGLRPIAMGEFWWGESTRGEVRQHLHYYPACRGKCHPILSYMLQGLDVEPARTPARDETTLEKQLKVIYEDEAIVAFDKPSGLPTVRGLNHTLSLQSIAEQRYPDLNANNIIVHRLDMDTSGVVIIAKSAAVQAALQQQFADHTIRKRYIALLAGAIAEPKGAISLPLILDPLDRPRQRVDFEQGKPAYTFYSLIEFDGTHSRIALYPQTGRTHQLRVHCAHHLGLGMPIVGDRLYGTPASRLMLHAEQITLLHPLTGRKLTLRSSVGF
ncbi:MAG: pseudouridine synthase [Rikenellaceae bacterium]